MEKFYNINKNSNTTSVYIYGEIVGGSYKWDDSDVTFDDFRNALDTIKDNDTLELYINSPGGNVYTTQGIMNMITRTKQKKKCNVIAYIDGLGASCAGWLPMCADEIRIYKNSMMMLHKPMSMVFGNTDEMQKEINLLNKMEDSVIVPAFLNKSKDLTSEDIKNMLKEETWLNAEEISNLFNVTVIDEEKEMVACLDSKVMKNYKNIPENLKGSFLNKQKPIMSEETKKMLDEIKSLEGFDDFDKKFR